MQKKTLMTSHGCLCCVQSRRCSHGTGPEVWLQHSSVVGRLFFFCTLGWGPCSYRCTPSLRRLSFSKVVWENETGLAAGDNSRLQLDILWRVWPPCLIFHSIKNRNTAQCSFGEGRGQPVGDARRIINVPPRRQDLHSVHEGAVSSASERQWQPVDVGAAPNGDRNPFRHRPSQVLEC